MKNNISHQSSGFLRDGYGMAIPGLEANPIYPLVTLMLWWGRSRFQLTWVRYFSVVETPIFAARKPLSKQVSLSGIELGTFDKYWWLIIMPPIQWP